MNPGAFAAMRSAAVDLLQREPEPSVEAQELYRSVHVWALRGMGYGLGDHPTTSGERGALEVLAHRWELARRPGLMVFDVGANVGDYAAMVLERFGGATAWLHCFEPSPRAYVTLLDRMAARASVWPQTYSHLYGLSDADRTMSLHADALGSGMASVHPRRLAHFGRALDTEERATFRRLDDVCRGLDVDRIDLLKLDVEGHELAVLRGAGPMLTSGAIGMIQWEMGGCNLDSRTTFQDFWYALAPHYDLFRVVADGLVPVPAYREQDEIFICSNFVAIWRSP